jgi:hypothetical protein
MLHSCSGIRYQVMRYQIFWEIVCLERGSLRLVSTIEDLLERKSSGCEKTGRRDPSRWPRGILYPQKLWITSPTSIGRSVRKFISWIQPTEFFYE